MASDITYGSQDRGRWTIALGLLFLSCALRIYRLDQGLWYDEIWAAGFFHASWKNLLTEMPAPNHHPLYSLLAKTCLLVFGNKEWALRLPAFVSGALTPPLLYLMGARWLNARTGIMAGIFMSAAVWPVWFSQDARGYSTMILLILAATWLFLSLCDEFSPGRSILYVLVSAAAIYAHLYSGAVIASHLISALFISRKKGAGRKGLFIAGACAAGLALAFVLYFPFLPDLYEYSTGAGRVTKGRSLSLHFFAGMFLRWSAGERHAFLSLLFLMPAAGGVAAIYRKNGAMAGTWVASLLIGALAPAVLGTFVYKRFYSYAMPGFYLAAAAGLDFVIDRVKFKRAAAPLLAGLLVALAGLELPFYYKHGKQGLRPAAGWVRDQAPGYRVLTVGMIGEVFMYYCPWVIPAPKGIVLDGAMLRRTVVVYSYPSTVEEETIKVLEKRCGEPVIFPSAGDPSADVYVYKCD